MRTRFLLVMVLALAGCGDKTGGGSDGGGGVDMAGGDDLAPSNVDKRAGIYLNSFSGGFSGTEWFEVVPTADPGHYSMTDIFGGGFAGTIGADGAITLDQGVGTGSFSDDDHFQIKPKIGGGTFTFACNRAPFTTAAFPLRLSGQVAENAALAGTFSSHTTYHDADTGAENGAGDEVLTLAASNGTLRITDPQGAYFQGVFVEANRVAFRVAQQGSGDFATFSGSSTNTGMDVLGEVTFTGNDAFKGTVLLQSRAQLGQQMQVVVRFDATRQ